jgi:Tol biopolymer transport system component/photosystem II stability/assembly factor-like uncharacterized protein
MKSFSPVRRLSSPGILLTAGLCVAVGVVTSWATLTGYTANRPASTEAQEATARSSGRKPSEKRSLDKNYGKLALSFEANRGQAEESAKFLARGSGYNIFFTSQEAVMVFSGRNQAARDNERTSAPGADSSDTEGMQDEARLLRLQQGTDAKEPTVVRMRLAGMKASPEGVDELEGKVNYFLGSDSAKWLSGVPTFAKVAYRDAYPGIDLMFYGNQQQLEYDLVVAPEADPGAIQIKFDGVDNLKVQSDGSLRLKTKAGEITQLKPEIYQDVDGGRKRVAGSYVVRKDQTIGFKVSKYDRRKPLVIDPILNYLSFINGSGEAVAIAADPGGNTYITGQVFDANLSPTIGAYQTTFGGGGADCFVTKLNPSGSTVLFTTYLGGAQGDYGNGITFDASGNVYVVGAAGAGFPTTAGAYQTVFGGGSDGFITKLNPGGSALIFSTLIGGNSFDEVDSITLEQGTGNIFVSGLSASTNLLTTAGAFQTTFTGGLDGYVAKFNPNGSGVSYLTYVGAAGYDYPITMTADAGGNVYLAGSTSSLNFPTLNAAQSTHAGNTRGVFKTNNGGTNWASSRSGLQTTFVYSTAINPSSPNIIYIGTDGGVYKSTDNGANWNPTPQMPGGRVHQLLLVPGAPNVIYAGTESGVFRSIDSGASWVARNNGLGLANNAPDVRGLAIHASSPNTVYAATTQSVFKSTDGGGTWTAANSGISSFPITALTNAIVIDPSSANTLYVMVVNAQRVWKTVNGGTTWTPASTGLVNGTMRSLAINPTTPAILYAATPFGIYKTSNGGTNWAASNTGLNLTLSDASTQLAPTQIVTVDPVTPTTIYAGATGVLTASGAASVATVFKSIDSGANWTAQSNGFGGINSSVNSIAVDPSNAATVYSSTAGDTEAYLFKLNPSGGSAVFSTYLGGTRFDAASGVAVDANSNVYISGQTNSAGFPTTGGAFQTVLKGFSDLFVTKFNSSGAVTYSTLIGGLDLDQNIGGMAIDAAGSVYLTAATFATDFPVTPGAFQTTIGNRGTRALDAVVVKVNPSGSSLDYSSYLGGDGNDQINLFYGNRLALDGAGNVYVAGATASTNFPYFDWPNSGFIPTNHTFVAKIANTAPSYSVIGRITNSLGAGIAGVFVYTVGAGDFFRGNTTDAQGYYSIISLPAGDYTVTPDRYGNLGGHYIYAPPTRTFTGLNSDQTANFVATQVYDIFGTINYTPVPGLGVFDIPVTLSGTVSANAVSDISGTFAFRDLPAGNYTVTPAKPGFTFNPVNRVFNGLNTDQFASFSTTSGSFFTINGRTADGGNAAISNATIALQVRSQIGSRPYLTQTDANGNYSFPNLQGGGNYTVMATKPLQTFTPLTQIYTNLAANQTLNFTGAAATGLIGKIAFVRQTTGDEVAIMNADGTGEAVVANASQCSSDSGPVWSPDGSRLAFSRCDNFEQDDLYVINADGTGLAAVTSDPHSEVLPGWSPDGTRLTYTFGECSGTDTLVPEIFAVNISGSLKTNLTNSSASEGSSDWSPGGSSIVFARGDGLNCSGTDGNTDLYAIDAVGGNERRLTNTQATEFFPVYSPDGTKIAYSASSFDFITNIFTESIFVMNADGTGQTQITPEPIFAGRPSWSPDGSKLAFEGFISGGSSPNQIYVVNADGTGLAQITGDSIGRASPSWQHYSISGRVTGNTTGVPITMTLAGTLTRVARTDAAGNYVFGNLTPGGNYSVTPISNAFGFSPAKADINNLVGNQVANFTVLPAVIPAPTPPLADDFDAGQRDPAKWNLGTQTQPLGAFDPQIPVVQQSGRLVVTPRSQTSGLHYNGYVAVNSFDFSNSKATVEVAQTATNGAETIFAIGSDLDNFSRFVVRAGGGGVNVAKGKQPKGPGLPQLIFQVRVGGQLTSLSIPYDANAHRYMRFRHEPPTNSIVFETSPNNVDFTVRHSVVLQKSVSALTAELSAGTSSPTDPGQAVFDNFGLVTNTFQFAVTGYTVNESANRAVVTVTRSGDLSAAASVDFSTFDDTARQKTRYIPAVGTLAFAPGQTSRTFNVLLEDNSLVEGSQTISLRLLDSSGAGLNSPGRAVLTVDDNDSPPITTNPLDNVQFFVRQNYYDFLNRTPDQGGLDYWTSQFTQCGSDQACINLKRIDVSNAFYFELEFQQTGSYVYRLYRAAYGNDQPFPNPDNSNPVEKKKLLSYTSFFSDRARVIGGANLAQSQLNLANSMILRPEFLATYPLSLNGPAFVDAVLNKIKMDIGVDLASQRAGLIDLFNSGGRGAVIYRLADDNATNPINNRAFIDAEYNRAFVATQYFGYLRRNPDLGGFVFWLNQVNSGALRDVGKQHAMVCSFVTSTEYQERLSLTVTHSNNECQH